MKIPIHNQSGKKMETTYELPESFELELNTDLVKDVYVGQMANSRQVLAHTKTRSERRGGGRKPWAQKGTGRARHGSARSPIWRKGGITFGPRSNRSYGKKINKKANRKALFIALSEKVRQNKLAIYEELSIPEAKTKEMVKVSAKVPLKDAENFVFVIASSTDKVLTATRNLPEVKAIRVQNINLVDLLHYDGVVFEKKALDELLKAKS